jgi:hypothetical protein
MLLTSTRFRRAAVSLAAVAAQLWPALVLAQAQVEAVPQPPPAFDMWNLDAFEDPALALPGEPVTPPPPTGIGLPVLDAPPPATSSNTNDPCRHFTQEERRLLPSLCGVTD